MEVHSNKKFKKYMEVEVRPPNRAVPFPNIQKPHPVGFFSINADRDFEPSDQKLRYLKLPTKFPLDLNAGLEMAITKPESYYSETLDVLLKFVNDHYQRLFSHNPPDFITWRGTLQLIMCTPYENQDWCFHVTRFHDTLYLLRRETRQKINARKRETTQNKTSSAYHFKFKKYSSTESPLEDPDTSAPVNEYDEFYLVFQTRLADLKLLYGAEMDCIISDTPVQLDYDSTSNLNSLKYAKLKVRQGNLNANQYRNFLRYKTRQWFCQSFLVGIKDLYVGMRNEEGFVDKIEHMDVRSLPKLGGQTYWSPSKCANFLLEFLVQLRAIMANENCPHTVYELYFNPRTSRITYERFGGKTEHSFLPDWYINFVNNMEKTFL